MEENVPFEMIFYQSYLSAEQEFIHRIKKDQARKNKRRARR